MTNNYLKVTAEGEPDHVVPFDDTDLESCERAALDAANYRAELAQASKVSVFRAGRFDFPQIGAFG